MNSKPLNSRAAAAQLAWQIIDQGQSMDAVLSQHFETGTTKEQDRSLIQELVYGQCRWYGELNHIAQQLLRSPIRKKDRIVHFVLLVGLYQLRHLETAQHAAVTETVNACKLLNKVWAKKLINGCLRTYLRKMESGEFSPLIVNDVAMNKLTHPTWIRSAIETAWPKHANEIFVANNQRPAMCLRVNTIHHSRADYLAQLENNDIGATADPFCSDGIILERPVPVTKLPGFYDGDVSIQDTAAQLACDILRVEKNQTVLDACAAPGGKSAHILERTDNSANLTALDISEKRCAQLNDTLQRLKLNAQVHPADATQTPTWLVPKEGYDRILIDAPCSGLGVIRRHPDIKHHRRPSDIASLNNIQSNLLSTLWTLLKPGGKMLYMTCSVLPEENDLLAGQFVMSHNDAMLETIDHPSALSLDHGVQTLPGVHGMDGFYYCLMSKKQP